MKLAELNTPALILDRARLVRNTLAMSARAEAAGVTLRPHMKTAKSADVARLATAGHTGGITVSTLAEARYFLDHGFADITYAVCMVPAKLAPAARLVQRGARLTLLTDSAAMVTALDDRARQLGCRFRVLIEIDSGEHRTGIDWQSPALPGIAETLRQARNLDLEGVLTHAGHSYACTSIAAIQDIAEQERQAVVGAAERLRAAGHACRTVSAGSTPTAVHATSFAGLSEIRPGVYMFFDLAQLGRQTCKVDDIAISVLATVIGHQPEHKRVIIDAGGLALSKDTSANEFLPGTGYGWVCDLHGKRIGDLHVAIADQEHGYVEGTHIPYRDIPVGSRVRILPNHACMTAAAHSRYAIVDSEPDAVEVDVADTWERMNGW